MPITLVDPRKEEVPAAAPAPRRLNTLAGKTVGLLDISKPGGSIFLDRVAQILHARYGVAQIERRIKPTFTKPAPDTVIQELHGVDAVIEALAD